MKKRKITYNERVLKYAHRWNLPDIDTLSAIEIKIINEIFSKKDLRWSFKKKSFVLRNLVIKYKNITNLKFLPPLIIETVFRCEDTNLSSLEGGPLEANYYACSRNKLKDLRGAPLRCKKFIASGNPLKDFKVLAEPYKNYIIWVDNEEYYDGTTNSMISAGSYATHAELIFIDPSIWTYDEYIEHEKNMLIGDTYI